MNKRQAMMKLLDPAYIPQVVPAAFFLHFDPAWHEGKAAVDKHLEFFRFTDMDFVKIQFEHDMPAQEIKKPADWAKVPVYRREFWEKPLAVVKGIVEAARKEAVVILTLYSPFMLAGQVAGAETVVRHIQEDPAAFKKGMAAITEGLLGFVKDCIGAGLDGFYASTQGGEKGRLADPASFADCVRPYDMQVMSEINRSAPFNILHVCDYHMPYADISSYTDYPGHIVNTSLKLVGKDITAREVARVFDRPFMGGLERKGVIAGGTPDAIRAAVRAAIEAAPARFILGADCTVPPTTPWENLKVAIKAAHEFRR